MRAILAFFFAVVTWTGVASAQDLRVATVERPPFSSEEEGVFSGFSIELMEAIASELGVGVAFEMNPGFADMLGGVTDGTVDAAIANISITGARETEMDFSQPIFRSGLAIMANASEGQSNIWSALLNKDIAIAALLAFGLLFGGGMLMWVFERKKQPYFDRPAAEAMFPSFWWALNLVVNGGFEERMPRSFMGRIFGVLLVISSLFIVSVFVAKITTAMTVEAINSNVDSINDLEGKAVGTTTGSTASAYLADRQIAHADFPGFAELIAAFEAGEIEVVFFDAPLLAYYITTSGKGNATLIERTFRPENYGIALPANSPMREQMNVALLRLRENGDYDEIYRRWFGAER